MKQEIHKPICEKIKVQGSALSKSIKVINKEKIAQKQELINYVSPTEKMPDDFERALKSAFMPHESL